MNTPKEESEKAIVNRLARVYQDLALYWMGKRTVHGYQTVEYISEQAAHCTSEAVHYARYDRMLQNILG
jgi:hypothetical protein